MELDSDVVQRARAGDRAAWAEIWDAHGPQLHAYARRLLSSPHDVDDAVADTFVSAAEHLHELRDDSALRAWLYAICRRHVQRRWSARDRVRPVEPDELVRAADAAEPEVTSRGLDAAEAQDLLWSAAEGLGPADRELLALVLGADLDSGGVAAVTGQPASAVYVKVSRLKDSLGRAAGALLVARHHRADCSELDELLHEWDGVYSTVWRKRIARHVDGCATCEAARSRAAAALFGAAGLAPLPLLPELRRRCLEGVGSPEMVPVSFDAGWPVPQPWEAERRRLAVPLLAGLLVLGLLALLLVQGRDPAAPLTAPVGTPLPTVEPSAPVLVPSSPPVATGAPRSATPAATRPAPSVAPVPTAAPTTRAPLPPAPTVQLTLSERDIQTACGSPTTSLATVTAAGQGVRTTLTWDGTSPGSAAFAGSGTATIGPYASVADASGTDQVSVVATVTDGLGRRASATRVLTVTLAPC